MGESFDSPVMITTRNDIGDYNVVCSLLPIGLNRRN